MVPLECHSGKWPVQPICGVATREVVRQHLSGTPVPIFIAFVRRMNVEEEALSRARYTDFMKTTIAAAKSAEGSADRVREKRN